ncbi:MAG: carboxypeptidase-like regulatory domain-containing protein [Bacteroidota bacterium]
MNLKKAFCILLLVPSFLFSQEYKGTIKSSKTSEGLPYVNIGVPAKAWGFLSDENGNFKFKATSEKEDEVIQISLVGYQTVLLNLQDLKGKCENNEAIYLNDVTYQLSQVTITPNDYETRILGNKKPEDLECMELPKVSKDTAYIRMALEKGLDTNAYGIEFGNKIKIKEGHQNFIDKVQFKVCLNANDTAIYRINIYTKGKTIKRHLTAIGMVNEEKLINVMKEPVIVKAFGKTEVKSVDLSAQNIEVADDFIVGLECIYSSDQKMKVGVAPSLFGSTDLFCRISVMSEWIKIPLIDLTFVSASVSYKKVPSFWQKLFN